MKNNLFYYATSELSQDAFLCWLCSFAMRSDYDPILKTCARQLLVMFVPELANMDFMLLDVERNFGHIDVLLTISAGESLYKVIVEDKTFTSEHDNQLQRYLELIQTVYPDSIAKGVYYKTGFQSDLSAVIEAGYNIITREQMLSLMAPYAAQTANQIFQDYFEYWSTFQKDVENYRHLPISKWDWKQVNGFYDSLRTSHFFQNRSQWMGYGYVANRTGGFYGLWFGVDDCCVNIDGIPFEIFLQLETTTGNPSSAQLCLKFCSKEDDVDKEILSKCRNKVVYDTERKYVLATFNFRKPKRLACGRHMTIGIYNCQLEHWHSIVEAFDTAIQDYSKLLSTLK